MASSKQLTYTELNNKLTQRREDGFFNLDYDKQARDVFLEEVNNKTKVFPTLESRYRWLIKNNYYYDAFRQYTEDEIDELDMLLYSYNFEFQSFMAAQKFYKAYALKTNDKE